MTLGQLYSLGFDRSTGSFSSSEHNHVGCSQCQALVINGVPTHEHGCPHATGHCAECDAIIPNRQRLCADCASPDPDDDLIYCACGALLDRGHGDEPGDLCEDCAAPATCSGHESSVLLLPCENNATGDDGLCDECRDAQLDDDRHADDQDRGDAR